MIWKVTSTTTRFDGTWYYLQNTQSGTTLFANGEVWRVRDKALAEICCKEMNENA